jgi:FRG domain-containing protein
MLDSPQFRKNAMTHKQVFCPDWDKLQTELEVAKTCLRASDDILWFRGCPSEYGLMPTLMRDTQNLSDDEHLEYETSVFYEFQARASELRERGLTEWELLFFGRHYGVPTRVLDWTDTFGVALYFALEERLNDVCARHEPAIWVVNPYALNKKTWGNPDIALPENLGSFGKRLTTASWRKGPVAVFPIQINDRVSAQRGWFTVHGKDRRAIEKQLPDHVVQLILKPRCTDSARKFLDLAGINRYSLYPDLENLASWIRQERLRWAENKRHATRAGAPYKTQEEKSKRKEEPRKPHDRKR